MLPDPTPSLTAPDAPRSLSRGTSTAPGPSLRGRALIGLALALLPTVYAVATRDGRFTEAQAGAAHTQSEQPFAGPESGAAPAQRKPRSQELEAQGGARVQRPDAESQGDERRPQQPGL